MKIETQIQDTVDKLKQFENDNHLEFQKSILNDLLLLKQTLLLEISQADVLPVNNEKLNKTEYQLKHLKKSYLQLLEKYENDKKKLQEENESLSKKIESLSN